MAIEGIEARDDHAAPRRDLVDVEDGTAFGVGDEDLGRGGTDKSAVQVPGDAGRAEPGGKR